MKITKVKTKEFIKDALRATNTIVISPKDEPLIADLKKRFEHNERSFIYGKIKRLIDCLYCHAAPGVLEKTITELLKQKPNTNGKKFLNLGGGTGQVPEIFKYLGFIVYNLDLEVPADKDNEYNRTYDLNSPGPLPYPERSFDVILCQEIIEHIENPWKLFRDAKSLLKDDGVLIVSTPNVASSFSRWKFFLTGYFKWFSPGCFDYHINPIQDWEMRLIADKVGFEIVSAFGSGDYYFPPRKQSFEKLMANNEEIIYFFKLK